MEPILEFLASHQAAITAIATIFIAVSAVVTTILTRKLARENELLRKAGTEPEVIAYLEHGLHQLRSGECGTRASTKREIQDTVGRFQIEWR